MNLDFSIRFNDDRLQDFAEQLQEMSHAIGFKVSSRGWGYLMEQDGMIDKSQLDKVENLINDCRRKGFLPVDFVAEEDARAFSGVEKPTDYTVKGVLKAMCQDVLTGYRYYTPDWWEGEDYYIQMVVEKIDLKTLFEPVAHAFHIPVANAKGWSSILQRAEYARRFKDAEDRGLQCILLYCGDHDPDGLRIADTIRANLEQISQVTWDDGEEGYDPECLEIVRFGLTYSFIREQGYTWIDNLITGSKKNLADPNHRNYQLPYVQQYLRDIGERKCEANAIVTTPRAARELVTKAITDIVGERARDRFQAKTDEVRNRYLQILDEAGVTLAMNRVIESPEETDDF